MADLEFQTVVARLAMDQAFLEWFRAGGDAALSDYDLTPEQRSRIHAVDLDAMANYQAMIVYKTWIRIKPQVLVPRGVPEPEMQRLLRTFVGVRLPAPEENGTDYAISFIRYAAAHFESRGAAWIVAGETLRHRANWLAAHRRLAFSAAARGTTPALSATSDRFRLNPLVTVDRFTVRVLDPDPQPTATPEWLIYVAIDRVRMLTAGEDAAQLCLRASVRPQSIGDHPAEAAPVIRALRRDRILIDA